MSHLQASLVGGLSDEADFDGDEDNSYALAAACNHPTRFRVVIVLDESDPDIRWIEDPLVVGIRLNLIGKPIPPLHDPSWRRVSHALRTTDGHLEVQATGPKWGDLADLSRIWDSRVVIDYLGRPNEESLPLIEEPSDLPHVWTKLSAPLPHSRHWPMSRPID